MMTGFDELQPVARQTTASVIAVRIREGIRHGTFPPGSQLGEARLANSLGVSRGPVREAFQRLIQQGLLHSEPHRGVFVKDLDAGEVADIYLARRAVERAAVIDLADGDNQDALTRLRALLERMDTAAEEQSWDAVAERDLEFHSALVTATGSPRLQAMFDTLMVETAMCLRALEEAYPVRQDLVAEHRELLDVIRGGDRDEAAALVDQHLRAAVAALTEGTG